ncbi:MAG: trypsin-like peptidase domain-containing protein [Methylophilaceae bacterium]
MFKKLFIVALAFYVGGAKAEVAEPSDAFLYGLKQSLMKVISNEKSGGLGHGTGVAISKNHVVTNCHVIANTRGITIRIWGESYSPVSMQADWKHDLCIMRFEWANLTPVALGDSESLKYEQPIISISMPGDSPAPYIDFSKIKALYAMDGSEVIRTQAAFAIGASGSPIFDYEGKLIGISTFKSPGHGAYYYNMPVAWIKALLQTPEVPMDQAAAAGFWDAPEEARPFFMRIVLPFQNKRWEDVKQVAQNWLLKEPNSVEANYYAGMAEENLGDLPKANQYFKQTLILQPQHPATLFELGLIANRNGNQAEVEHTHIALKAINTDLDNEFTEALKPATSQ